MTHPLDFGDCNDELQSVIEMAKRLGNEVERTEDGGCKVIIEHESGDTINVVYDAKGHLICMTAPRGSQASAEIAACVQGALGTIKWDRERFAGTKEE